MRSLRIHINFSGRKFSRAARGDGKIEAGFPIANLSGTKLSLRGSFVADCVLVLVTLFNLFFLAHGAH